MAIFASHGTDATADCANCSSKWSVDFLVTDIGRARLRSHGFTFLWFDDGAISVNTCPHCELPQVRRETYSWLSAVQQPV